MVSKEVLEHYKYLREYGYKADSSLRIARMLCEWDILESEGLVRKRIELDDNNYTIEDILGDCCKGLSVRELDYEINKINENGIYFVMTEYYFLGKWHFGGAVCGLYGYEDVADYYENECLLDCMWEAVQEYKYDFWSKLC